MKKMKKIKKMKKMGMIQSTIPIYKGHFTLILKTTYPSIMTNNLNKMVMNHKIYIVVSTVNH